VSVAHTVSPSHVYHIGAINVGARNAHNLEGGFLAVSRCPNAWMQIARLGGNPCWQIDTSGIRMLDMHRLPRKTGIEITRWATAEGLLEPTTVYRVEMTDEEGDTVGYMEFGTRGDAIEQASGEESYVTTVEALVGTAKLREAMLHSDLSSQLSLDFGILAWAERAGFDGAWWPETYEPDALSAPRGCIFRPDDWPGRTLDLPSHDMATALRCSKIEFESASDFALCAGARTRAENLEIAYDR